MTTPDHPNHPGLDQVPEAIDAELQKEINALHLPPTDPDDPRLAIPELLRESNHPRRASPTDATEQGVAANLAGAGKAWAIAFEFVFTIVAGIGLGWLFDRWKHTTPTGALVGMAAGFVMAFYRIVRATQAQDRAESKQRQNRR